MSRLGPRGLLYRRGVDIGAILSQAWILYTRFFVRFIAVAGVVFLILGAFTTILDQVSGSGADSIPGRVLALVVSIVGFFWIQGVLVVLTEDVRDGVADHPIGALFARVRPKLAPLILAGVLATVGIVAGLLLLIAPGLYLLTRWSLIGPALIVEDLEAGESFTRSHELVRGHGAPVFGLVILLFLISFAAAVIVDQVVLGVSGGSLATWLAGAVANTLISPFLAIVTTLVYFHFAGDAPATPRPSSA